MLERGKSEVAAREEEILAFWKENNVFTRSLEKHAPKGEFIFYDGPPFATGLPHHGSLLSSIIKDVVPRYKTMRGYRVPRRWGWDCHGLPIENMVEKKLNLKTKKDILAVGIDVFNETARSMVLEYVDEWEKYIDRVGRWVDFKNSYKTMDNNYIESVWWTLKELNKKKMLYEGRKVLMYCPHCETPLAKAEIAADNTYKDITEEAVTVKFKLRNPQKFGLPENTHLLAWTTTPWTLPGNVGLAVGADIAYVYVEKDGAYLVVAKDRLDALLPNAQILGEFLGQQLLGAEYEPLFSIPAFAHHKGKKYLVLSADFVTTTEGTGVVHTAVMYGEDDFALGTKEGLPMVQLLNANGTYNDLVPEFIRGEYIKKAEKLIKEDLEKKNLLFVRENHTHSYPHCYRCGTPLIYNAVASWFINIQKIKQKMLKENERINWVPAHLKQGRFKHIMESAPDWTISRNRFWASPLPVWKERGGKGLMVVGSIEELLKKTKHSGNEYFVMRHGEAQHNVEHVYDSSDKPGNHLTDRGKEMALASAETLKKQGQIDLVITSPFLRTRQTAQIVQKTFGLPDSAVVVDDRLHEMRFGVYDGRPVEEWRAFFKNVNDAFNTVPEGAETYVQIRKRVGDLLFDVERRYLGKRILFVTHEGPAWLMSTVANRWSITECAKDADDELYLKSSEWKPIPFIPYPHNAQYELDLHRPYIDAVVLEGERGATYERTPEVLDCWVESGAMPYASNHYPFENKDTFNPARLFGFWPKGYPADFIAEYIAQTRTWFYYMHVMGLALFNKLAFKNVVSTGTILAADGSKMSKSKGNYTDPLNIMDQFGADALRFYLMGSVVMSGEDFNFKDEDVREAHNRVVGILWNCYKFFDLYKNEWNENAVTKSTHVLDQWVLALLANTIDEVTRALDAYDTPMACKAIRNFVEDYSTWYVRRSRERVKGDDAKDKQYALATQREVLLIMAQLCAPIMPYIAESMYKGVGGRENSVHLDSWPLPLPQNEPVLSAMAVVRRFATVALKQREEAGIKVRQPLSKLTINSAKESSLVGKEYLHILAEEINVKTIVFESLGADAPVARLDTTLTVELTEEGVMRGIIRRVQEWRKAEGLTISDRPSYTLVASSEEKSVAEKYRTKIIKEAGLSNLEITEN